MNSFPDTYLEHVLPIRKEFDEIQESVEGAARRAGFAGKEKTGRFDWEEYRQTKKKAMTDGNCTEKLKALLEKVKAADANLGEGEARRRLINLKSDIYALLNSR